MGAGAEFDWSALDAEFREATRVPGLAPDDANWWDEFHAHVAQRAEPQWFLTPERAPDFYGEHWPALKERWVAVGEAQLAGLVMSEVFRPVRDADGVIDWGANPLKVMAWAGFHYWTWANAFTRAYAMAPDERYPAEVAAHLKSFFEQMDTFTPETWPGAYQDRSADEIRDTITFNALSAGAKMATLTEAVMVFRRAASWTPADLRRATLLLVRLAQRVHADYAGRSEAEYVDARNFLTSGAMGLGAVAAILPECAWSQDWSALARFIHEAHLMGLFCSDGGHRELCTQYHKAGIRDILFLEQILHAAGRERYFSRVEPYRSKLTRTLHWLAAVLMPNGSTATLNSSAAASDWLMFFVVANKWLRDPELQWHINRWWQPDYLPRQKAIPALGVRILGDTDAPDDSIPAREPAQQSILLPESGVAVLRDGWGRDANAMTVDFGRPVGGHAYPAQGSFNLYLRGRLAAQSPGSPHHYTDPDYADWMHRTRSQNTVLVDDQDQEQWAFSWRRRVQGEILEWQDGPASTLLSGRHDGYLLNLGIDHRRTVKLVSDRFFLIHDVLDAAAAETDHLAKWSLHCPGPLREEADRVVVSEGLLRVVPYWPDQVTEVRIAAKGKAVLPEPDDAGRYDRNATLTHARWHVPLPAGSRVQFLMLLQPDETPARILEACEGEEGLAIEIEQGEERLTEKIS